MISRLIYKTEKGGTVKLNRAPIPWGIEIMFSALSQEEQQNLMGTLSDKMMNPADCSRPREEGWAERSGTFDLITHLRRQIKFSEETFGPGPRAEGIIDHIRKELKEIKKEPTDLEEWIDVVLLAFDGAWREGHTSENIAACLEYKQTKNERREWPDWRTAKSGKAIEHIRSKKS